jgi:hypothetical protein
MIEIDKRADYHKSDPHPRERREIPVTPEGAEKKRRAQKFHENISERYRLFAFRAFTPKNDPGENRNVAPPFYRGVASGAMGRRRNYRFAARNTPDDNVQKRAYQRSERE